MTHERFASIEVAKLLKETGVDWHIPYKDDEHPVFITDKSKEE